MEAISYSHARAKLAKTMERVCRNRTPVVITRQRGEATVLLSLEDYEALEETSCLLRSPKNARRLLESIAQLEAGRGKRKKITLL
ncbi:MAG: type II toxin-antitoxin system prevent-host-death family antitoxin [Deltaproteobacteria bacterium]|nr:type II toxin-antitoxin system prevent-host-death family antitoxin [Deltaproteobacteria bacterium]